MPERYYIACGCSIGLIVASFFLAGFHHEVKHQWWLRKRQKQRGGWIV